MDDEYGFVVEHTADGAYTVSANDGTGLFGDLDDVEAFMHRQVRWWCRDLRDRDGE